MSEIAKYNELIDWIQKDMFNGNWENLIPWENKNIDSLQNLINEAIKNKEIREKYWVDILKDLSKYLYNSDTELLKNTTSTKLKWFKARLEFLKMMESENIRWVVDKQRENQDEIYEKWFI